MRILEVEAELFLFGERGRMGGGAGFVRVRPRDASEAESGGTTDMPRKERGVDVVLVERHDEYGDFEVGVGVVKGLRACSLREHEIYNRERVRNGIA